MSDFRKMIHLSIALMSPLVLVLFGTIMVRPPAGSTALANSSGVSGRAAQKGVELSTGYNQLAQPGNTISFTHMLTNTGSATDRYTIKATTPMTWPIELLNSGDLTGSQQLSLTLGAGTTATIYVSLTVPHDQSIISGTLTPILITATSQLSPTIAVAVTDTVTVYTSTSPVTYTLYLPTLTRNGGVKLVDLGVDFSHRQLLRDTSILTADLPVARQLGAQWTRAWLPWALIETSPGQYDWTWADLQLNRFAEAGFNTMAVIYYPPAWAASSGCGPITNTAALDEFVTAVVNRYGKIVKVWEFINEPDGRAPNSYGPVVGCWSPQPQLYAEQLAFFYNKVKTLDPTALVAYGGLAYDYWVLFDRDFFTHTLASGAGPYFDILSLHFYPINPQDFPTIASKINEIKAIMQRYDVHDKMIWVTETSMWTNGPAGLAGQQNYIVQDLTRGFCAGADKLFWFAVREEIDPPLLKRWLINLQHQPDQGYYTFQHYANQIRGAFCRGPYTQVPANIEAYNLSTPTGELYILWATTGSAAVSLPAGSAATLIDRDGQTPQPLTPVNGVVSLTVGTQSVFVVTKP